MKYGYGYENGKLILQFVPGSPSEVDSFNEAWALIRNGAKVALRFEDFEPGVAQVKIIVESEDKDDETDD
jgi:hypothetical protein